MDSLLLPSSSSESRRSIFNLKITSYYGTKINYKFLTIFIKFKLGQHNIGVKTKTINSVFFRCLQPRIKEVRVPSVVDQNHREQNSNHLVSRERERVSGWSGPVFASCSRRGSRRGRPSASSAAGGAWGRWRNRRGRGSSRSLSQMQLKRRRN